MREQTSSFTRVFYVWVFQLTPAFIKKHRLLVFTAFVFFLSSLFINSNLLFAQTAGQIPIPKINFGVESAKTPQDTSVALMILFLITIISLAPAIAMMMTSFVKVVIVFDFARRALSLQSMPPNQVMVGLALFITLFIMTPTIKTINKDALQPYVKGKIKKTSVFFEKAMKPLRKFMIKQLYSGGDASGIKDVALFLKVAKIRTVKSFDEVPTYILIPSFMLSEIKKAFIIGVLLFIPFIIIDMVVASTLMSMGMIMLPPVMISLPFKIILFISVDGWNLITMQLIRSYM